MRQSRTSGPVGARGEQSPGATRPLASLQELAILTEPEICEAM